MFFEGYGSNVASDLIKRFEEKGIHARPLGNVLYFMCNLNTPEEVLREVEGRILEVLDS
jgi:adenosylmethionine-8-amino-7-oxononanoate aminotransferase